MQRVCWPGQRRRAQAQGRCHPHRVQTRSRRPGCRTTARWSRPPSCSWDFAAGWGLQGCAQIGSARCWWEPQDRTRACRRCAGRSLMSAGSVKMHPAHLHCRADRCGTGGARRLPRAGSSRAQCRLRARLSGHPGRSRLRPGKSWRHLRSGSSGRICAGLASRLPPRATASWARAPARLPGVKLCQRTQPLPLPPPEPEHASSCVLSPLLSPQNRGSWAATGALAAAASAAAAALAGHLVHAAAGRHRSWWRCQCQSPRCCWRWQHWGWQ